MRFDPQTNMIPADPAAAPVQAARPPRSVGHRSDPMRGLVLVVAIATVLGGAWLIYAEMPAEPQQPRVGPVWQSVISDIAATEEYVRQVQEQAERRQIEDESRAAYELGRSHLAIGKAIEAIPHLKQAVRLDPAFAKGHYDLGMAYVRSGNHEAARAELLELRAINPSLANLLENLVR